MPVLLQLLGSFSIGPAHELWPPGKTFFRVFNQTLVDLLLNRFVHSYIDSLLVYDMYVLRQFQLGTKLRGTYW